MIHKRRTNVCQTLIQLSLGLFSHRCQHAQDQVFGLLGLVHEDDLETNNLVFDTSISVQQLYTDFSAQLLTHCDPGHASSALWHYLSGAFTLSRDERLPSWVPDLHKKSSEYACKLYISILFYKRPMQTEFGANRRPASLERGLQSEKIVFEGSIMDKIVYVHPEVSIELRKNRGRPISVGELVRCFVDLSVWEETLANEILSVESRADGESGTSLERYWRILSASPMDKDRQDLSYHSFQAFRKGMRSLREALSELRLLDR